MIKKAILLLLVFTGLTGSITAQPSSEVTKSNFHIYLCIGQSNMDGQAAILPSDTTAISNRLWNLSTLDDKDRRKGEWRKAIPPIGRRWTKIGPTDFFLRTLDRFLPDSINAGVVHVAIDGCASDLFHPEKQQAYLDNIKEDWMRNEVNAYGGHPLDRLIEMARQAQKRGVIRGILYHQGETDAYSEKWLMNMKDIYYSLLDSLGLKADEVPLYVGETARKDLGGVCGHANPTIDIIGKYIPTAHVISSEGCEVSKDGAHFSHRGYELLGTRYGLQALKTEGYNVMGDLQITPKVADNRLTEQSSLTADAKNGKLTVSNEIGIDIITLTSWSGKVVGTYKCKGRKKYVIDTKGFDEKRLFVTVKDVKGKTVRTQVNLN